MTSCGRPAPGFCGRAAFRCCNSLLGPPKCCAGAGAPGLAPDFMLLSLAAHACNW